MTLFLQGSDYIRSSSSTWYYRMDNFLMGLGFTESKVDSNLYFKVEGGIPMLLLLYVDAMFLTREYLLIEDARRRLSTAFDMK